MEGTSFLRGQPLTTLPSLPRQRFLLRGLKNNRIVRFSALKNHSDSVKSRSFDLSLRASGPIKASSGVTEANPTNIGSSKEQDLVFVAGATGKVGSRTVRELLKLGFRVRAGVRSAQRASSLVQSVKEMKLQNTDEGTQPVEKLEIVECDLEKTDSIQPALGNASVVICCIGASEKEISDITGPYRIDYLATKNLVDAATSAKVNNFILVTSLGTNKFGFPAAILNLFWGVLCWKRKAEEALIASGLNYAIVRPGGMERPTDAYKETHNLTLALEDTLFGGQVSNLQVAELLACMAKNPKLSFSKIVEVVAETTAPLTPIEKLLEKIPSKRLYVPPPKESVAAKEVTPVPTKPVTQEPTAPKEDEATAEVKDVKPRPLSPYAAYEDLKPPTSPIPSSATSPGATKSKEVDATEVPVETNAVPLPDTISNVAVEEEEEEVKKDEEKKETDTISNVAVEEEEEVKQAEEKKERPLSPYASYENLKPPSSPSPKASGTRKSDSLPPAPTDSDTGESSTVAASITETEAPITPKMRPLSPYAAYADLKPPTSPTPASTGLKETASEKTASAEENLELPGGNDVLETVDGSVNTTPPSSVPEAETVNNVTDTSLTSEDNAADKPKPRPLSPYTMYEDMKPPTSPLPSPVFNH
ncbi:unnamed protein product [Thlaspi arvense]|uniref:NAD(P)-binding domain-containing protein n=1 Tax=Thlaspi arvense TaxID=13288 RepID=A0AAU9RZE1_THLAR|nr:unnamed protein product [Thlaspi arvense]